MFWVQVTPGSNPGTPTLFRDLKDFFLSSRLSISKYTVKKFIKNKEDFICSHCGIEVKGSGYTNHCPHCLWSMHVDINPGDRLATCGGKMKPISIEGGTGKGYKVVQVCTTCGHTRKNGVLDTDNINAVLAIIKADASKRGRA